MADPKEEPETPLFKKIVPARGAAQKAAQNLKQQHTKRASTSIAQLGNKSDGESDAPDLAQDGDVDEGMKVDSFAARRRHGARGRRARGRGRGRGGANNVRAQSPVLQPGEKPMESCLALSPRRLSSLTSLDAKTPQKRPRPSTSSTPSKRAKVAASPSIKASSSLHAPSLISSPSSESQEKYGDIYDKGDMVWVRLNSVGNMMDPQTDVQSYWYWWPAQVTNDKVFQMEVKLFGDDGHGADRLISISSPSSFTILSFRWKGRIRFSPANFTLATVSPQVDPFEAQPSTGIESSDLTSRWKAALDLALVDDEDEELPDPIALLDMTMSASKKGKEKRDRASHASAPTSTASPVRPLRAPPVPLDEEIRVGKEDGELVLARDHKDRPDHWPARVVGLSQNKRTGSWLYEVCFIDGKKKKMDRTRFFSSDEEGFATCQMGIWRTELAVSDTEGVDSEQELRTHEPSRISSPSPSQSDLEDFTDRTDFCELPVADQMRYVYPFLCRTIRREYQPSFERHDAFMKGGKGRENLGQTASLRGEFSENEVKKVSAFVRKTMLRNERWAERLFDGDDVGTVPSEETAHASDGTKAGTVAESVASSDLDAAMALAGLKSSEECTMYAPPAPPTFELEPQPAAYILPTDGPNADHITESSMPPPSSMSVVSTSALDHSSDMEVASDDENPAPETVRTRPDLVNNEERAPIVTPEAGGSAGAVHTSPIILAQVSQAPSAQQSLESLPSGSHAGTISTSRRRPVGCVAYENLSRSERSLYCADVLLPEAVLQLHLLRAGRRSSAHLLTPEEETKLYEDGRELLQTEVHWVIQIVQLRRIAERAFKKRSKKKDVPATIVAGGTSSRPKMVKPED